MHNDLEKSGLSEIFKIRPITGDLEFGKFLGKRVRVKRELLTKEYIKRNGTCVIDSIFLIKEVQLDYEGGKCLRGYNCEYDDIFGKLLRKDEIEIID